MRIFHAFIIAALASTLVLETAFANTYNMPQHNGADYTHHGWAIVYSKTPVQNRGQVHKLKNCTTRTVPVYSNTGGEALGSIFGLLLGAIVGHKAGGDGGAVAGALIGGATGNQLAKDPNANRTVIGQSTTKHCTSTPVQNKGNFEVIGFIYKLKDSHTGQFVAQLGTRSNPSTKNYFVGQKIPYSSGARIGN